MKILVLSFYYAPDLCAGSFRTTSLVNQLKEIKGVELDVITTMPNRYASFEVGALGKEFDGQAKIRRIQLPHHKSGMLDQIRSFYAYYKAVKKLVRNENYDMVFATSSRLFTAFLGARISKSKKIPLYLDIRDIFVDTIKDLLPSTQAKVTKPFLTLVEDYAFKNASHINLVSKGFEEYFRSRFRQPSYSWFTNGIDKEFLELDKSSVKVIADKVNILYAGNCGEGQGLHNIIPALAENLASKYQITIIGDGGRHSLLRDSVAGMSNVILLPPVKRHELVEKYLDADILFLHLNDYPAFEKVLPSKIFEYAAIGKPILAGVSGYSASFIHDEVPNAEVFYPNNAIAAIEALERLDMNAHDRSEFINKYQRSNIMSEMAKSIISVGSKNV
ncbi:glycosyltransferase family 4 protein [Shewanella sp. 10N.286.48.B5]|uniref:glycosyltransferase family 4 protein n=1 Tax=Shewanella sp. 10N.286.48.B5 TaxID=1880834 RepID=UPI000C838765|nr:glycosyltransferase family 4 protein [Shewanella sp. 10N.286.48.B5]PMH87607.1 glycosyltransferase WbuB [Shewanella sp. 10N.286.48.B5]